MDRTRYDSRSGDEAGRNETLVTRPQAARVVGASLNFRSKSGLRILAAAES